MNRFLGLIVVMVLILAPVAGSLAAEVGRLVQVEGQVDLLKGGNLPAATAKVQDPVEPGDVIRTKSQAKAQVRFLDDTTLTIAPGSRVAIESYMFDAAQGTRQGVLQVLQGMVYTVVTRILKTEKPDFLLKTHTAVTGVRGTKWYALLNPNSSDIANEEGVLSVANIKREIAGDVLVKSMFSTRVETDQRPTAPTPITQEDLLLLQRQLQVGLGQQTGDSDLSFRESTAYFREPAAFHRFLQPPGSRENNIINILVLIPPRIAPGITPRPAPTPI